MNLKETIFYCAEFANLNKIFRFINRKKIVVLMYHGVVPDNCPIESWTLVKESAFRTQMEYLKKYYNVISIHDAITNKRNNYSKPRAVITFDDGYRNNYSTAYPILKQYGFPATIFLVTEFINSMEMLWYDKVVYSIQHKGCTLLDLSDVNFGIYHFHQNNNQERWTSIQDLLSKLKKETYIQREEIVQNIDDKLGPVAKNKEYFLLLRTHEIEEMNKSGLIDFGAHTCSHEILTQLNPKDAQETILKSIIAIEKIIKKKVKYFAYPNGDFNNEIKAILEELDIILAFTVINGLWTTNDDLYEVSRKGIGGYDSVELYGGEISGLTGLLSTFND